MKKQFIPRIDVTKEGVIDFQRQRVSRLSETIVLECDYLKEILFFAQKDTSLQTNNDQSPRKLVDLLQRHASEIGELMRDEMEKEEKQGINKISSTTLEMLR